MISNVLIALAQVVSSQVDAVLPANCPHPLLLGRWKSVSVEYDGDQAPGLWMRYTWEFDCTTFRILSHDVDVPPISGEYTVINDVEFKRFIAKRIVTKDGIQTPLIVKGIYKIEGDKMTRCFTANDQFPKAFRTEFNSEEYLQVLNRVRMENDSR